MSYQDWLNAVDAALKANQRGFTTGDIDPSALGSAFNGGISPVVFARQAVAAPRPVYQPAPVTVPTPGVKLVALTYWVLILMGWLAYVAAAGVLALWLFMTALTAGAAVNAPSPRGTAGAALLLSVFTGAWGIGTAFGLAVAGAVWHFFAITLSKAYNRP